MFDRREDVLERGAVPLGADEVLGDLPGVTDVRVGQRLLATAEPGRLAEAGELAGLRRGHRESDGPEALNRQAQVVRPCREADADRGLHVTAQRPGQPVTRRRHHRYGPPTVLFL